MRGPAVEMNPEDARNRLLNEGELAWVYTPRRHQLAQVYLDAGLPRGDVILHDIAGASASERIRVIKPDLDTRGRGGFLA
jgi:anaerobic selenocysteine-containing dehydrogenase